MRDVHSEAKINLLHPKVRECFTDFINDAENSLSISLCIVQGMRTFAEQQAIYNQGRTTPGEIVTWSPPGSSYHNYGLAIDVCPFKTGSTEELDWGYDFSKLKPYSEKHGLTWGGDFPKGMIDTDHFENKLGYNWRTLLHDYNAKDFIPGTTFVNI
jgi:peptidoglycan L-alanyl-D-glutamate endopeptidase CwlK